MQHPTSSSKNRSSRLGIRLLGWALSLTLTTAASAGVMVTIQPSADLADIVWTVEWDSLAGADGFSYTWDQMDPAVGSEVAAGPWGPDRLEIHWKNVGDPFSAVYVDGSLRGFGDGVGGVVGSGPWGVGPDYDPSRDDLYIFSTILTIGDVFPTSGSFVLTVPGAHLANYNIGVYEDNPNARITVTDTPYGTAPVPEPSTLGLVVLGLAAVAYRKRRAGQ